MKFEKAFKLLKHGEPIKRVGWENFCLAKLNDTIVNITFEELHDPDIDAVLDDHRDEGISLDSDDIMATDWEEV